MKKSAIVLNTQAHRPMFTALAELLRGVEHREGLSSYDALMTFTAAAFYALRGVTLIGTRAEENEAQYIAISQKCRKPTETMGDYAGMLAQIILAFQAEPIDFLGPVFSELCASAEMGQFFTPYEVSSMMARMTFTNVNELLADKPYISIAEPACGVGGMVLAANHVLREMGIDVARRVRWQMTEIDRRAFQCAYIQAALTDTSAIVIHGNTLSLETWERCVTPTAIAYHSIEEAAKPPEARIRTRTLVPA